MNDISKDFKIRSANERDLDGIMLIDKQLGSLHPNLDLKVKQMLNDSNSYFLVATFKEKIVGYAGGTIRETEFGEGDPVGYITHIALSKDFASKGMGRILGDKLIDAMSLKCENFRTILSLDRNDLQSYFNQIGFKKSDLMVYEYST